MIYNTRKPNEMNDEKEDGNKKAVLLLCFNYRRIEQVEARQVYSLEVAGSSPAPATNPASGGGEQLPFLYYILCLAGGCGEYRK